MNEDLFSNITKSESLRTKLANPQFMAAFGEFQSNPQEAARKYGDNAEMKEFIREFSGLLGNHFTGIAAKKEAQ